MEVKRKIYDNDLKKYFVKKKLLTDFADFADENFVEELEVKRKIYDNDLKKYFVKKKLLTDYADYADENFGEESGDESLAG